MLTFLDTASQFFIFFLGCGSVILVGSKSAKVRRWGYISGVASEPFWFFSTIYAQQWFILAATVIYTVAWVRGLINNWNIDDNTSVS